MFFRLITVLLACGIIDAAILREHSYKSRDHKEPWALKEVLSANGQVLRFNGTWITDKEFYYTAPDKAIRKFNAATGDDTIFVPSTFLELYSSRSTFTLSPDNAKILVRYDLEEVFRHSFIAKYDIFDIATRTATKVHNGTKLQFCAWSPIKDRLSFVHDNNVWIHFEEGLEVPITTNGQPDVIYNGIPDWVYEEEVLASGSAMWWSADGLKLAVGVFNDSAVKTFNYAIYGEAENPQYQYPKEIHLKYPKPGTPNPLVALRLFTFRKGENQSVILTAPKEIVSSDHILQNVAWSDNNNLLVTWLNRRQNIATIQSCTINGECREVKRLEEKNGWITIGTPKCLKSTESCIFTYWIDNWYQIWNLDLKTGQNIWKSRGDFTVLKIYGYDEQNDKLYYQATLKEDPSIYQVFSNDQCLTCELSDPSDPQQKCRSANAEFSKNFSYYTAICNGPGPAYSRIFATKSNSLVKEWEPNLAFRGKLERKQIPEVKYFNVTLKDGSLGFVKLQLPPNWDPNKKYPMIVNVYGGPNSVRVTRSFSIGFDTYMTTTRDVIYAVIDGRGTGNKGKKTLFTVNNNLGEHEVEDQIEVTKYLQEHFGADRERTGIWGWSYGGYMTAKTLESDDDAERVFQCGVAVAPVTSWLYYDTIYTERYMGLPQENGAKYNESSVLKRIENFRNHDFLLVHGSGDDNVHYQQSLMLAKVLQRNDIMFEEMTYTDENHSIGNFLPHLYNTLDHFWINCLNLDVDGAEY